MGYPTQFSNAPFMVRDFIKKNGSLWKGKKVFCVSTMGLFSGDGTGCTARILKKYSAEILGGLQIKMPYSPAVPNCVEAQHPSSWAVDGFVMLRDYLKVET